MLNNYRHSKGREFFRIDIKSLKKLISSLCPPDFEYEDHNQTNIGTNHSITMVSRDGIDVEEREMQNFADRAKEIGVDAFVQNMFYDSNSCCCQFNFSGDFHESDKIAQELLSIALETISQFEWFGSIQHGSFVVEIDDLSKF